MDKKELRELAKKNLKTMRKTSKKHLIREESRIIKYGTIGFARNIWLSFASTAVTVITLVILFATIVASVILANTAESMREKIDITIYLKPKTSEEVLVDLTEIIKTDSNIKTVETSTSEEEYEKFVKENENSSDVMAILEDEEMLNIMISKMQSTMHIKVYDIDNLDSIKELVATNATFKDNLDDTKMPTYDVNQIEIRTITSWARIIRMGGIILGIVFLIVSVLVIFSTIRMAIFSRREEIYMMKLVGADKSFIRGPFLIEAEICGIIAGVLSATIGYYGFNIVAPKLLNYGINISTISDILETKQLLLVYLVFIIGGVAISRISARLAISKYLSKA